MIVALDIPCADKCQNITWQQMNWQHRCNDNGQLLLFWVQAGATCFFFFNCEWRRLVLMAVPLIKYSYHRDLQRLSHSMHYNYCFPTRYMSAITSAGSAHFTNIIKLLREILKNMNIYCFICKFWLIN